MSGRVECPECGEEFNARVASSPIRAVRDWVDRRRISPSGLTKDAADALELLLSDMEAGDVY